MHRTHFHELLPQVPSSNFALQQYFGQCWEISTSSMLVVPAWFDGTCAGGVNTCVPMQASNDLLEAFENPQVIRHPRGRHYMATGLERHA